MRRRRFSRLTGYEPHDITEDVVATQLLLSSPRDLGSGIDLLKCYISRTDGECVILVDEGNAYRTLTFPLDDYQWMEITLHEVENPEWRRLGIDLKTLFLVDRTVRWVGKPVRRYFVGTLHFVGRSIHLIDSLKTLRRIERILGR